MTDSISPTQLAQQPEQESALSGHLPRKVLHILNSAAGGAALSTLDLIRGLRARGVSSCIVCDDRGTETERQLVREAVDGRAIFTPLYWMNRKTRSKWWKRPIHEVISWYRTGGTRYSTRQVVDFALKQQVDLIHTNTIVTPEGGLAALRLKLPHVWHLRELVGPDAHIRFQVEGSRMGDYWKRHCSVMVPNSEISASHIYTWLPPEWVQVVPNGIVLERFPLTPQATTRKEHVVVAMVGNLTSHSKKHKLVVQAAALVDHKLPIEWRFYGHDPSNGGLDRSDPYVNEIHSEIRRAGLAASFRFMGFEEEPTKIMSEIDILIHPTELESFGRVFAEAMASRLPIVAVRGGGAAELVVDEVTGLLSEPNDPQGLAVNVARLAQDNVLRQTMGVAGRKRVEEKYSLDVCVDRLLKAYRLAMTRPVGAEISTCPAKN